MSASNKRFIIDKQSDPLEFLSWLVNTLHLDLTGGKRKKRSSECGCGSSMGSVAGIWAGWCALVLVCRQLPLCCPPLPVLV